MYRVFSSLALCLLTIVSFGCGPDPVVVDTDDGGTTVIEERDVEIERDTAMPPPATGSDVEVDVGGGKGVDVNVNPDGNDATPNR